MGVAVSALSATVTGCVAVEPHPVPAPASSEADAPRLSQDQNVKPQIIQAPAREALDAALQPSKGAAHRKDPQETPATHRPKAPTPPRHRTRVTAPAPNPAPARPAPTVPAVPALPAPPKADVHVPRILPSLPTPAGAGTDVCALGEGYGGWRPGSNESRICRETYGR